MCVLGPGGWAAALPALSYPLQTTGMLLTGLGIGLLMSPPTPTRWAGSRQPPAPEPPASSTGSRVPSGEHVVMLVFLSRLPDDATRSLTGSEELGLHPAAKGVAHQVRTGDGLVEPL